MKTYTTKSGKIDRQRPAPHGFTLIEVMIVLFILVVIASAAVVATQTFLQQSKQRAAELFIKNMKTPLDMFQLNVGRYPTTEESLGALLAPPSSLADPSKWEGPYVEENVKDTDPWGNSYQYMYPGTHSTSRYDLWSVGPDGISDTDDDICSWK